ncbi:hypothetical protein STEG23_008991 [Scotinomys teguina]
MSAQQAEVAALVIALQNFQHQLLNIYTDSLYVANIVSELEISLYIGHQSKVAAALQQLQALIWALGHIWGHSNLPGPLAEGNRIAGFHTHLVLTAFDEAVQLHQRYHLNAQTLQYYTKCSRNEALKITTTCSTCAPFIHTPSLGVNPRGVRPNEIWQMNVTHVASFDLLKYMHVSVDTYSGMIFASLHRGERVKDVSKHLIQAFAYLGVPNLIKTDNGPAYASQGFQKFCKRWSIQHKTGIPYNPQGQAIVERAHSTLKMFLQKIKESEMLEEDKGPNTQISFILCILNFLMVDAKGFTASQCHFEGPAPMKAMVHWKDLAIGIWQQPAPVLARVRGAVCVFPTDAERPMWLPERCVRPVDVPADTNDHEDDRDSTNIGTGAMDVGKESPSTNSSKHSLQYSIYPSMLL